MWVSLVAMSALRVALLLAALVCNTRESIESVAVGPLRFVRASESLGLLGKPLEGALWTPGNTSRLCNGDAI